MRDSGYLTRSASKSSRAQSGKPSKKVSQSELSKMNRQIAKLKGEVPGKMLASGGKQAARTAPSNAASRGASGKVKIRTGGGAISGRAGSAPSNTGRIGGSGGVRLSPNRLK